MTKEEEKANLSLLQEQFLTDLERMLAKYENKELARLTRINAGNLSRYKKEPPGPIPMQKFYNGLAGIIENPFKKINLNMEDNKENKDQQEGPKKQKDSNQKKPIPDYGHEPDADTTQNRKSSEANVLPLYQHEDSDSEIVAYLKIENAHHRSTENKLLDSSEKLFALPHKWLDSLDKMVAAHTLSNQKELVNAETQKMIIAAFVKKFGGEE